LLPSRRIVIDAGHGGKDPGAIGPSGVQEKDLVLSMALLLADEVKSKLGWEVVLTRNDDTFIPLEERTAIANKIGADLFLSLHVNASPNAAARGIETYYLNFSKNEKAAAVAARENGTTLRAVSDLEQILFDLMAHSKIQESSRLASDIQHALITGITREFGEVKNLGVKQGPFYVLLGANMPSVLVEAAFLSNPHEETRLGTRQYQKETTQAIIDGLRAYVGNSKVVARQ
jgi:N-acetylmuramoyl-L-alanine amidase